MKSLAEQPAFRYLVVGGVSYLVELATLYVCSEVLSLTAAISVSIGFWIGLLLSFTLQKILSFKNTTSDKEQVAKQVALYALLVLVNYGFTVLFVYAFESVLSIFVARTIALIITTVWNFFIYKNVIFR